jgi:hypothetical protein
LHQHDSQIEELTVGRFAQDSEGPDERQIAPSGFAASAGIIEQKLIGLKLLREGDGFPFSWIKETQRRVENGTQRLHLQPRGRTRDPAADDIRRFLVLQPSKTAGGIRMRSKSCGRRST